MLFPDLLNAKQGNSMYHYSSLCYDTTDQILNSNLPYTKRAFYHFEFTTIYYHFELLYKANILSREQTILLMGSGKPNLLPSKTWSLTSASRLAQHHISDKVFLCLLSCKFLLAFIVYLKFPLDFP